MTKFVLLTGYNDEPVYVNPATISCIGRKAVQCGSDSLCSIFTIGDETAITVKGTPAEVVAEIMRQTEGG